MLFDLVFLVGKNDIDTFDFYLKFNKKNIIGYRNIYIISPFDIKIDNTILIHDNIFPFDINKIKELNNNINDDRLNWYLQQLIKLYAIFVIPDILDNILIVDADTFFIKPVKFIDYDDNNKFLLNYCNEYFKDYFILMKKLDIGLYKFDEDKSGIVHHMLFNKDILLDLFNKVEKKHKKPLYEVLITLIDEKNNQTGFSEYEIYFNFCLIFHNDKIKLRKLYFNEIFNNTNNRFIINNDYISNHKWLGDDYNDQIIKLFSKS